MKNIVKGTIGILSLIFVGCASENCTKTITIPSQTITSPTGTSYIPESKAEVPCDYVVTPLEEQAPLQNFSYEILNFSYQPDTGNNTKRLQFDIQLTNPNAFTIKGYAYITTNADGVISSSPFTNGATETCHEISPNSSCIFSYDMESSLVLGTVQSIQIIDVNYYLTN